VSMVITSSFSKLLKQTVVQLRGAAKRKFKGLPNKKTQSYHKFTNRMNRRSEVNPSPTISDNLFFGIPTIQNAF
jgi:hypothetical protein